MQLGIPNLPDLFAQLGLPSSEEFIARFVATHRPDALGLALPDAPVWTEAQAEFLREAISADADWALPAEWLATALCQASQEPGL